MSASRAWISQQALRISSNRPGLLVAGPAVSWRVRSAPEVLSPALPARPCDNRDRMATLLSLGRESSGRARLARRLAADPRYVIEDFRPY
jgi:hypothetical protein